MGLYHYEKYIYKYINFNKTYSGLFNNNINFVKKNKICKYGCLNLLKEMVENHYKFNKKHVYICVKYKSYDCLKYLNLN